MKTKVLQTMPPETSFRIDIDITIFQHDNTVKFFSRCFISLVKFSYWFSFMSISSLFLGLWQFSFTRNWPEILKWEIPLFEFFPISEDWDELGIPDVNYYCIGSLPFEKPKSEVYIFKSKEPVFHVWLWGSSYQKKILIQRNKDFYLLAEDLGLP